MHQQNFVMNKTLQYNAEEACDHQEFLSIRKWKSHHGDQAIRGFQLQLNELILS